MDLKSHLQALEPEQRGPFAVACGTTLGHMRNVAYGIKSCSAELAVAIEQATNRTVTRRDLRPDDWHRIWPELVSKRSRAPQPEPAR